MTRVSQAGLGIAALLLVVVPPALAPAQQPPPAPPPPHEATIHPTWFGEAVVSPGDLDGDGTPDIVAGAPGTGIGGLESGKMANAGMVLACSGRKHTVIWRVPGTAAEERFGAALAAGGDFNGDGKPDVLAGAPGEPGKGTGAVRILSGADGALLLEIRGLVAGECLGLTVASAGDVDGDGVPDVLTNSCPGLPPPKARSVALATVFSGKTGKAILVLEGPRTAVNVPAVASELHCASVAVTGNLLRGGGASYLAGCPQAEDPGGEAVGAVLAFAARGGAPILTLAGDPLRKADPRVRSAARFGAALAAGGDANGDGVGDILVGSPRAALRIDDKVAVEEPGCAFVYSGANGKRLLAVEGFAPRDGFGLAVAWVGDLNGDGRADFAVGAPCFRSTEERVWPGRAGVYSGKNGKLLFACDGTMPGGRPAHDRLGASVAGAGDLDGDRTPDVLVGAPDGLAGFVHAYSGRDGSKILSLGAYDLEAAVPR
jgi:hypothetical protein